MLLLAGSPPLWTYAMQGWHLGTPAPKETTVEYQLSRWLAGQAPQGRVFASGGLRFRLNPWFDIQPVGGGSRRGWRTACRWISPTVFALEQSPDRAMKRRIALLKLKALGAPYVAVHGPHPRNY
jgi:hypothetical protein